MNLEDIAVFDAHCHIHETPGELGMLGAESQTAYCVQATKYTDWGDVIRLKDSYGGRIIPALGIHPWFVERVLAGDIPDTWAEELRQQLAKHGGILGECGLDKAARNPETKQVYPLEPQIQLLETQLAIAHDLDIPVSLHCVRAFGALADVLRRAEGSNRLPPLIMLHSYSGSPDMLQQMFLKGELGRRTYVSVSALVNGRNRAKSAQCIQCVSAERLLVESDLHGAHATVAALDAATALVAEARGWSLSKAKAQLASNARTFF
ncbi:Cut9-interacting protein scn1, partial [Coemansia sp. RSA 2618]